LDENQKLMDKKGPLVISWCIHLDA